MKAFYTLLIILFPFVGLSQSNISCSPQLTQNIITCNDSILLETGDIFDSYLWSTGENSSSIIVNESGNYNVSVFCNDTINLRIFKEQEGLISTMQGVLDYQLENPLTDRLLIMDSEIISNYVCENLETLLNNIDVALFTSQANFYNCNWIDIIPVLDDFMRNGGTVIILGNNDGGLGFVDSSPNGNWPDYYTDYISQDLADDWFNNLIVDDYQYTGLAVVNENCANGQLLFNNSFENNILFNNVYDYPYGTVGSNCNMMLYNPVGYNISESDLSDDNFFSIYKYQENSVEDAIEFGNNDQIVLGKSFGSGELILYGDKQPNNSPYDGSRNLLGNIIHYFSIEPTSQANINVTIDPNQVLYATDTQVHCDTYTWIDGNTYTSSNNIATHTLTNAAGCDSIVLLDLTINNSTTSTTDTTVCGSYTWNDSTYTQSGTYYKAFYNDNYSLTFDGTDDYVSFSGMDGVYPSFSFVTRVKLNSNIYNQSLFFIGQELTGNNTTGSIDLTIDNNFSPERLQINLNYNHGIAFTQSFNYGDWIDIAGVFDGNNQMLYLYIDGYLEDSVLTEVNNLSLLQNDIHKIGAGSVGSDQILGNFFDGSFASLSFFNKVLTQAEIDAYDICPPNGTENGIISHWNFQEGNENTTLIDISGNGNDGEINGAIYSNDVPPQSCQLTNINDCDSTAILNLTINNSNTGVDSQVHCGTFTWIDGNTYTSSNNTATHTLTNAAGCDSIVLLDLTINNSTTSTTDTTVCGSYTWNDSTYTESGTHTLTFSSPEIGANVEGGIVFFIDSSSNLAYVATQNYIIKDIQWGCSNFDVDGAESTYVGGGYQNTQDIINSSCGGSESAALACVDYDNGYNDWFLPSLEELYLIYENLYQTELVTYNTGNSQNWYWSSTEGTNNSTNSASSINFSDGFIAENNNKNSDGGGVIAIRTFSINNGCDSVAVLNLTVNLAVTSFNEVTACDEFSWDGQTYTESGEYTNTYTNINGCDSTHTLNLTINSTTMGTDTQVHCDTYTWIDGNTYTESNNTATFTLTNSNNCDSIVTLNLIINNSDNTSSSVTACDEFTWDGQTYTESGEYTITYTNTNGCDSTHTLNLTINNSISSNTEASSCSSYEWNGMIYQNSGTYEFDTIASNGCDSIAVLELEICYLDQLEINGPNAAVTSTTSSFSVQENAGSIYEWSLSNELGEISSGQNSNEINVDWSTDEGLITICVLEKYDCSGLECLGDTVCLEVELKRPASIVENNLEVNIYPNPSSNIFNIEFNFDSETEISVINILGEGVYFKSIKSIGEFNTQIDLSNYSKGIYNLTIKNTNGISNHKLILQ